MFTVGQVLELSTPKGFFLSQHTLNQALFPELPHKLHQLVTPCSALGRNISKGQATGVAGTRVSKSQA